MFTLDDVAEALEKFPAGWEDMVNPYDCLYTDIGGAHCFVGQVLEVLGVSLPSYHDEENGKSFSVTGMAAAFDTDAIDALSYAQRFADGYGTWGMAAECIHKCILEFGPQAWSEDE